MLVFSNRELETANSGVALTRRFQPGADRLSAVEATRSASGSGFDLSATDAAIADDAAVKRFVPLFRGSKPVLVYLHGNNNTPKSCFERCARLQETYDVAVVGFSWPSEGFLSSGDDLPKLPIGNGKDDIGSDDSLAGIDAGNRKEGWAELKIRRYRQAKLNAQESGDALARFLRLLATARLYVNQQRVTLAAHSLGCHLLQYTIETEGAAEALGSCHNIALLAACCRADGHESWVGKLNPKGQTFIAYNKGDSVLFGAYIADGQQTKLGTEPGDRIMAAPRVRYISFTNAQVGFGGHTYFVRKAGDKLPKAPKKVFSRIFGSEQDIREAQGEYPRKVYPVGCDEDGTTCYMGPPPQEPDGR